MTGKPQVETMPLSAHRALTPSGSVGLSTLTQAGYWPQQLPTSFTVHSASERQLRSIFTLAGSTGER